MPSWVQASSKPGQTRLLHPSGAEVLIEEAKATVRRSYGWDARRAADEAEEWLLHAGYKWAAGTYFDTEVVYQAQGDEGVAYSEPE